MCNFSKTEETHFLRSDFWPSRTWFDFPHGEEWQPLPHGVARGRSSHRLWITVAAHTMQLILLSVSTF